MKTPTEKFSRNLAAVLLSAGLLMPAMTAPAQAINQVLSLDGVSGYVTVTNAPDLNLASGDFTISAWVFLKGYDIWNSSILTKRQPGSGHGWMFYVGGLSQGAEARKVALAVSEQADQRVKGKSDLRTNQWQHVAVAYSSTSSVASLYVNGELEATTSVPAPLSTTSDAMLGRDSITSQYLWNGQLDEVCIWNRALTREELASGLSCPRSGGEQGLLAYWNFDTGSVKDVTGHGHNGTFTGSAAITPVSGGDAVHAGCGNPLLDIQVSQVNVCWEAASDKWYQLQYRSDLTANEWVNLGGLLLGTGSKICITDDVADLPRRFYRAVVVP